MGVHKRGEWIEVVPYIIPIGKILLTIKFPCIFQVTV
jgi:hypothetical protein